MLCVSPKKKRKEKRAKLGTGTSRRRSQGAVTPRSPCRLLRLGTKRKKKGEGSAKRSARSGLKPSPPKQGGQSQLDKSLAEEGGGLKVPGRGQKGEGCGGVGGEDQLAQPTCSSPAWSSRVRGLGAHGAF